MFPYSLSESGYNALLSISEQSFKRLWFKRILSHMLIFSKQVFDSNIEKICQICLSQKIGVTLLEFALLLARQKIVISEKSFSAIVNTLKDFKDVNEEIDQLCREFMLAFNWDISFNMIDPYITSLVKQRKTEKYMVFLEKMRDHVMSHKPEFNAAVSS